MSTPAKRIVPPAGSIPGPWLWQIWAGDTCTVTFCATNYTARPSTATLFVIVGFGTSAANYSPPSYSDFARKKLPLSLAPEESRNFSCEFPVINRPLPNTARIEVTSSTASVG